jgi:hypothetical protein
MHTQPVRPLGLPGSWTYVWYVAPHDRESRRIGSVTVVLARPEATPDPRIIRQAMETEGDSHIAVCRPAVDIETPNRTLNFETHDANGNAVTFRGDANSNGYLGKFFLSGLGSNDAYTCETVAMQIMLPTMSLLSFANDVPLFVWQIHVAPIGTNKTFVRITSPFAPKRNGNRQHVFPHTFAMITAAYREGLNLTQVSPLFAFLLFYRVIEATKSLRAPPAPNSPRIRQRIPAEWDAARIWLSEILNTTVPSLEEARAVLPKEALNKRYSWLVSERLRPLRNQIAHGLIEENDTLSSVDDPELQAKCQQWMPVCRLLARAELTEVGGLEEVPLGLPPAIAMQQRGERAARDGGSA